MDTDKKDANGCIIMSDNNNNKPVAASSNVNGECDSDSNSLLPPQRGSVPRNSDKAPRKVQWNDKNGNKLAEVLEYEPSAVSYSEDGDSDSCICTIM